MAEERIVALNDPEAFIKSLKALMRDCERLMKQLQASELTEIVLRERG